MRIEFQKFSKAFMLVATCGMYVKTCLSGACYVCHSANFEEK